MDKNKVAGSIKEIKGAAKEAIGKAIGDAKLQSDGKAGQGPRARSRTPSAA